MAVGFETLKIQPEPNALRNVVGERRWPALLEHPAHQRIKCDRKVPSWVTLDEVP